MKNHSQWARFQFAVAGVVEAWRRERSFRTEVIGVALMLGWMIWRQPAPLWWVLVILSACLMLAAELMNTAIEMVCDALHPDIHPLIKVAKDCGSAAVLMTVIAASVVGILVLWHV